MTPIELFCGILLTWWVAKLISQEHGPMGIFTRLRYAVRVRYDEHSQVVYKNELAHLVGCIRCLSVWVGWTVSFFILDSSSIINVLQYGVVFSAGAVLLEEWFNRG